MVNILLLVGLFSILFIGIVFIWLGWIWSKPERYDLKDEMEALKENNKLKNK